MATQEHGKDMVLFVDDEANILSSLRRGLHSWASERGVSIRTADSAIEALGFLEASAGQVVVIVSDLRMPVMLGSDFLLKVKELYPWILTILLTGFSEVQELMKAVRAGIYSFILKPWDHDYLVAELDKCLEAQRFRADAAARARTVEEELRWAGEMQKAFLKPSLEHPEGVSFEISYEPLPGLYCGGDYYDMIDMGKGRYVLLVGDVAGHGIRAAFITGILKAVIYPEYMRAVAGRNFMPGAFLAWLNERMNFELRRTADIIITFFVGLIDPPAGTLTYVNAGHCHPILLSGKESRELPVSGPSLGYADSVEYQVGVEELHKGDLLFAYSDGLGELASADGLCENIEVAEVVRNTADGPDFNKRVLAAVLASSRSKAFSDDVTIVTARIL